MPATDATPVLSGLTGSMWRTHHAVPRVLPSYNPYEYTPLVMLAPADNGGQAKPSRFAASPPGAMANRGIMGLPVRTRVLPHIINELCHSQCYVPSGRQDNMGNTKQQRALVAARPSSQLATGSRPKPSCTRYRRTGQIRTRGASRYEVYLDSRGVTRSGQ